MKVSRKTNSDHSRRKRKYSEKRTRRLKIKTLENQRDTKKNQLNILLKQNKKERKRIR